MFQNAFSEMKIVIFYFIIINSIRVASDLGNNFASNRQQAIT